MTTTPFRIGFLPLVDAALPILARELGFAEAEGISLELIRDISWATVNDRLLYGHSDAAHLLAPLAIATTLGLGRPATPLSVPFVLGLNGNAITLRPDLAAQVTAVGAPGDVAAIGARLAIVAQAARERGTPLRFGVVHRYSSHNYMLRYWLIGCGIDPDADVAIVTVAPPFAADALAAGEIDGICVGEPWNSVAVDRGVGVIVAVTSQIWLRGVEKVLAMRTARMEEDPDLTHRLLRALYRAGVAFVDPARREDIAAILARPAYLDGSATLIGHAISDRIVFAQGAAPIDVPDFMFQHREAANFPWVSQAAWLYAQMSIAGHVSANATSYDAAQRVFRPDVYRAALRPLGVPLPGASSKLEGGIVEALGVGTTQGRLILGADRFFDARSFDPADLAGYLGGF
ncbi:MULTISPECIES: ABC transporter substrate-binding protein [unclassified Sphingomonas]|uniref:ABC transporter substrate-binding protein n=1 Tax=unclassified Sphingomonas TaxID=196159 RepID=UPI0004DF5823|nr:MULTISPECIES: CmpA/NrtA family ABC transporter substrate-binding protein [unclassified Sphingomonas]MDY1007377.1 CmpA/NrtA family ABC transporter substrate-binding protein [Sphingomonas sp. CFBP9019]